MLHMCGTDMRSACAVVRVIPNAMRDPYSLPRIAHTLGMTDALPFS